MESPCECGIEPLGSINHGVSISSSNSSGIIMIVVVVVVVVEVVVIVIVVVVSFLCLTRNFEIW